MSAKLQCNNGQIRARLAADRRLLNRPPAFFVAKFHRALNRIMSSKKPTEAELTQQYNKYKNELQQLAQKIGELESEIEEHKLVIDSISPLEPDRKCFRMVGGVLVERTVKEVLPALETNYNGIQQVINSLLQSYKRKEQEFQEFQKKHKIQVVSK
ncbi:hypothetical protein VTP01DRAFT_8916 [Rhizomucor pusillus]|uniref:uncharacterized protein n=1 Tax=Rhizomucor pusillus TaxID=4840 RepID=UPI0037437272